ncbi:MAG: hypothetical protein O7D91_19815, partial [Planctomycetota bacterium]|nr:hypothetical protein [Planctomycetota bacterium]
SFPPTYASVRCFPGPPELEKAKEWALGLAQWQIEDQNLGVPVPEELSWEAVGSGYGQGNRQSRQGNRVAGISG